MHLPDIDQLWDYQDPAASERAFRQLLPRARAEGNAGYTCELLTQIARAVCLQRDYDGALALVDQAEALLGEGLERPRIRCLLERGRTLNDLGRTDEALLLFKEAWAIADRIGELVLGADALHMIAYVSEGEESLRWHQVAIEFCERCDGERFRRWLCTLNTNVADEYEALEDYDRAIDHVAKSLDIAEQLRWDPRIAGAKCFLARLHRLAGDVDEAVRWLDDVFESGTDSLPGYAYEERAECLLSKGDHAQARDQFRRAYELLSADPWFPPSEADRLQRIKRLAGLM